MLRCHGWQRATHVQDVRYVAVPWMAKSNACPWMDGLKIAPRQLLLDNCSCVVLLPSIHGHMHCPNKLHPCNDAFSALPTSMWVVSARSQEGGAVMSMDGRYSARSQEGGAVMSMDGRYSARSQEGGAVMSMDGRYSARSQEGGAVMSMDGRYSARSQEGGAVMSMDGRYSARSQEGGAVMSMDGRYSARSQEGGAVIA